MGSETKYCKCGHDKKLHKKNPDSKLSFATFCRECPCSSYLNRKRPDKSDYASTYMLVGLGIFLMAWLLIFLPSFDPALEGIADKPSNLTNGELHEIISVFLLAFGVLMLFWFVVDPLLTLAFQKNRKTFPIKDEDAKL